MPEVNEAKKSWEPLTHSEKDRLELFLRDDSERAVIDRASQHRAPPKGGGVSDPLKDIPPSLLSADDIARYFEKTGMIYPFSFEKRVTGEKPKGVHRLKGASYEGRIGEKAYQFDPGQIEPKSVLSRKSKFLTFPANSIVFVESDIYFRLPPYIAVRFNLQIRHVHRGLLLGTGPLVDPGYWGKLCIPIHNLTDEDYEVPTDEGLIWIEFTKTTSHPLLGEPPSNSELEDIEEAIRKSSRPYRAVIDNVDRAWWRKFQKKPGKIGIRSSIASVLRELRDTAKSAAKAAKESRNLVRILSGFGLATTVFGFLAIFSLWGSYRDAVTKYEDNIRSLSAQATRDISGISTKLSNTEAVVENLQREIDSQAAMIIELRQRLDEPLIDK
ncbi:hypothetical protein [Maritimibacter sp. 55A14]|uniref:hypothetical protein n=1 Tax=Maritimibacter sp. 55A14 TaxID=2174844 RepID=UPI0011B2820C|nr:hypothetical protein [Maritimibacter sp. 55A14]